MWPVFHLFCFVVHFDNEHIVIQTSKQIHTFYMGHSQPQKIALIMILVSDEDK